jgi:S-adenosylmethionine-diacylgycerolhomoserine-N-methlytransferase
MGLLNDLKVLYHLVRPLRADSHAQRMENFYSGQAQAYDDFRKRLLQGREELYQKVALQLASDRVPHPRWADLGGGTGANLEFLGDRIGGIEKIYVVDLAGSLLKMCQQRAQAKGWKQVTSIEADATLWTPPEGSVDAVTFSYSLTMIPDWFAAIDNALRILKPGGLVGVVDFYVARKHPADGLARHPWRTRHFWPAWFATDNVFPSPDHIPYLQRRFETLWLTEQRSKVPYMPLVRTPYYQFIGRKPTSGNG